MVGVCGAGSTKGSFHLRSIRLKTELIDFFFWGGGERVGGWTTCSMGRVMFLYFSSKHFLQLEYTVRHGSHLANFWENLFTLR